MNRRFLLPASWLAALLMTLCVGSLWSLWMFRTGTEAAWFALLIGASVWPVTAWLRSTNRWLTAGALALFTLAGVVYAQSLAAITAVSRLIGTDLGETADLLGWSVVLDLVWTRSSSVDLAFVGVGAVVAFAAGWWSQSPEQRVKSHSGASSRH